MKTAKRKIILAFLFSIAALAGRAHAGEKESLAKCRELKASALKSTETLVGYALSTSPKRKIVVHPLTILAGGRFLAINGAQPKRLTFLTSLMDNKVSSVTFTLDGVNMQGAPKCVWTYVISSGTIRGPTLYATAPIKINLHPSAGEAARFASMTDPFYKMHLLATSDVNGNGQTEYWYTAQINASQVSFSIAEMQKGRNVLRQIIGSCPYCY